MARLETQINQIYYLPASASQAALILTDEVLGNSSHLFVVADLVKIQKKIETLELKKISEIILNTFRENKKISGETLFETSLAEINQKLADLAHEGKKSWLGKFSALVVLKHGEHIFLANTGQMTAMLYRGGEFLEVLNPEKRGLHPLKTFSNFTAGKLKPSDVLLLTTSNLFSYIALQNLTKMMSGSDVTEVTQDVSKILKDTSGGSEGFASFFVTLSKADSPAAKVPAQVAEPVVAATPIIAAPIVEEEIYAPIPAQAVPATGASPRKLLKIPRISLPKFSFGLPKFDFWQNLSSWAKFFLVSFLIFLLLFASNVVVYTIRKHKKQTVDQTQVTVNTLVSHMNDAESALIYRNQDQAVKLLSTIQSDLAAVKNLNDQAYQQYQPKVLELANRINHITVINNPTVLVTLKLPATDLARAGKGFYITDSETGTVSTYNTTASDKSGKDLFLLNKIGKIQGLAYIPNNGGVVVTNSEMYLVDTAQSQFALLQIYPKTNLEGLRFVNPDRLYTLDKANNKVLRIQFSKTTQTEPVSLIKSKLDLENVVDLGTDANVYLLSPTDLNKYINGVLDANFNLTQPTDQITSANRLFVANNLYILESAKKRLLVYNKQGALVTQMFFPNVSDLRDLYVDEATRNIYLLDSNKILSITF
jgi:hypothetical protein